MTDLEDLVRETFTTRGRAVKAAEGLASAARSRATTQRRNLAGATLAALLVAVALGVTFLRPSTETVVPAIETSKPTPAMEMTWLSSNGVEVPIPKSWTLGDSTCIGSTFYGPRIACDLPQDPMRRPMAQIGVMEIEKAPPDAKPVVVDGHEATLATVELGNGLTQATLRFRSPERTVIVRAKDTGLIDHMINGVRFVDTDHAGCPTGAPPTSRPKAERDGTADQILPGTPREIALCNYGSKSLRGSALLSGQNTAKLIDALQKAPAGPNRDDPDGCVQSAFPPSPVVVVARYAEGPPVTIHITYEGCVGRRIDNGARVVKVTKEVVHQAVLAVGTPMGYHVPL